MNNSNLPTNSITQCLTQISDITRKNLAILRTLEEAFRTRKAHLAVDVDGTTYAIPSFVSLETRIETMEHNLDNLLNAPLTGEAYVYHDGTTQKLELAGYSVTPNHVEIEKPTNFGVMANHVFKDFMNPNPYVRLNIASIPNPIKHVNVRKVAVRNQQLWQALQDQLGSENDGTIRYPLWEHVSFGYESGVDFEQYDTIRRLPLRSGLAQGTYIIESIEDHHVDSNFDEHFTLTLDKDLVYWVNNGTIQRDIQVGDYMVTANDKVQFEVEEVNPVTRTITMKVMYGAYSDLQDRTSNNPSLYTIKYYHAANDDALREFNRNKYIDVPIEEDRYILIFVAPINDTTNVQAPWGIGTVLDTDEDLTITIGDTNMGFREYYDQYVNNIGDALASITSMMDDDQQVSRLTPGEFQTAIAWHPQWDMNLLKVSHINQHLNDAKSIKAIRRLYAQKSDIQEKLSVAQNSIDALNKALAQLSFDDTTNERPGLEANLREALATKNELETTLWKTVQEISVTANQSEVPIENAKYRIRGFIPLNTDGLPGIITPIKVEVQYRYKCNSSFTGSAETFDTMIFSDWNVMDSPYRKRVAFMDGNQYRYRWEDANLEVNEPHFNQVDIPITQGELVDMRYRYVYNLGFPFVEMVSAWSEVITMEFPDEYKTQVEVLDIVTQNNDDIQQHSFENILQNKGLTPHIDDTTQDQTMIFKHRAENIASGFFTQERRIIPLYDKLAAMDDDLSNLMTEVYGASADNLLITLSSHDNAIQLKPWTINSFHAGSYTRAIQDESTFVFAPEGENWQPMMAVAQLNINIKNIGTYMMRLHTMFPGDYRETLVPSTAVSQWDANDYCVTDGGVFMMMDDRVSSTDPLALAQHLNQFLYFRTRVDGKPDLYSIGVDYVQQMLVSQDPIFNGIPQYSNRGDDGNILEVLDVTSTQGRALYDAMSQAEPGSAIGALYPYPGQLSEICIPSTDTFITIKPGESINIPVEFVYWFQDATDDNLAELMLEMETVQVPATNRIKTLATSIGVQSGDDFETIKTKIKTAAPGQPIYSDFKDKFVTPARMRNFTVTRMMAFDIRTSLFREPLTYKFTVDASYEDTKGFKIKATDLSKSGALPVKTVVPQTAITKLVDPVTSRNKKSPIKMN